MKTKFNENKEKPFINQMTGQCLRLIMCLVITTTTEHFEINSSVD